MKLYGGYLSPFTRRVAISLHVLGIPFEHELVIVSKDPDKVRPISPLVRIPVLVLDDGDALVESAAILDEIDRMAGPERALTPPSGLARRRVTQATAIAVGCMEKAQWAFYEGRFHPPEKVHEPWIERNDAQALGGLAHLDALAGRAGSEGWIAGTPAMSQADISAAVAYTFIGAIRPDLGVAAANPGLAALAARCEALESFAAAPLPDS